jgi:uncharacterized protein YdaU (DUF1376 family)
MLSLTLEERGAFQTILDMIYDRGGPIVDNGRLLAGYMGVSLRKWTALRDSLIEKRKIALEDGKITNDRAIFEIKKSLKTSRKHAENGSKGGRKSGEVRKNSNENSDRYDAGLQPRSSLTRYQKPEEAYASPRESGAELVDFTNGLCRDIGLNLPDFGTAERNRQKVHSWVQAGADLSLIRETVLKRNAALRQAARSLAFFDNPVREAIAAKVSGALNPQIAAALRLAEQINSRTTPAPASAERTVQ